jgi:hypothetical protein
MKFEFRTTVQPVQSECPIQPGDALCFYGSCFSEHIQRAMRQGGFETFSSPHGILFDPFSIARSIEKTLKEEIPLPSEWEKAPGFRGYVHPHFHGNISGEDAHAAFSKAEQALSQGLFGIKKARFLAFTLGTAWYFFDSKKQQAVANCHQFPAERFQRRLASVEEIVTALKPALLNCLRLNPNLVFIASLSPVRHLRDGAEQNSLSKSILRTALHELSLHIPSCNYFPAFEILMDELRDYRFYDDDMCHPSSLAIAYIFEKFSQSWLSDKAILQQKQMSQWHTMAAHHIKSDAKEALLEHERRLQEKKLLLKAQFPFAHF